MSEYIIPNATQADLQSLIEHAQLAGAWTEAMMWDYGDAGQGGVLVSEPSLTVTQLEALYSDWTSDPDWRPALSPALRTHAGHLRDYEQAIRNGTPVTAAQTQHVIADIIAFLRLSEDRL